MYKVKCGISLFNKKVLLSVIGHDMARLSDNGK